MLSKLIAAIALTLIANTLMAQDANTTLPASFFTSGPAIEEGAFRLKYEETLAQVEVQKRLIADLRGVIDTLKASRCPCCESGECKCAKAAAAKLVMVSMPGCPACEQWWTNERPRYQASGWGVERTQESPRQGLLYPYWRLCIGDECQVVAWCPFGQLDSKIESLLARRRNK